MSKHKPATEAKRGPKRAAQRANQAVKRSPKDSRLRVAADPNVSALERHDDSKQEASLVEDRANALVANSSTALKQTRRDNDRKQGFDFSSTTANLRAYQVKVQELTQANMQFALEFAAKLASVRSPIEVLGLIVESTSKRLAMVQRFSIEMAELATKR